MFPSGQPQAGGDLEDRLRGMILSNQAASNALIGAVDNASVPPVASEANSLPPHLRGASEEAQARYFAALEARRAANNTSQQSNNVTPQAAPVSKQKRPNQAQRRQMNTQFPVPVDSRPAYQSQPGRNNGFQGQHNPRHQHFNNHNQSSQRTPSQRFQNNQQIPQGFPQQQPQYRQQYADGQRQTHGQQSHSNTPSQPSFRSNPRHDPISNSIRNNRPAPEIKQLYQPGSPYGQGRQPGFNAQQDISGQISYLEQLSLDVVSKIGIEVQEEEEKEAFRAKIEEICQQSIEAFEKGSGQKGFDAASVQLQCFGSMRSGYATKASDMDLALIATQCVPDPHSPESRIPRLLEKELLSRGYGARLLTRTRVPIIKLCERPTDKLLSDLREERVKWDHGVDDEHEDNTEGDVHQKSVVQEEASPVVDLQPVSENKTISAVNEAIMEPATVYTPSTPAFNDLTEESYKTKLIGLRQQAQQTLHDYHLAAKRLLKKLGGRDPTANAPSVDAHERKVLIDVCNAFVDGLQNKDLGARLRQYPSLAPLYDITYEGKPRSLQSLWTQAEGERLAMTFNGRCFVELNDRSEAEASAAVEAWSFLQTKHAEQLDNIIYARQLFAALEKLKKVNSLQINFFEQMPFEDPMQYFSRAQKLQQGVRLAGPHINMNTMTEVASHVAQRYLEGINNDEIKTLITPGRLRDIHRDHVRLQLVLDYEHALAKGIFEESDAVYVQQYIHWLKQGDNNVSPIDEVLTFKIQSLPDPTEVSAIKPRDPYKDKLEFPKTDIGIQCDINFSAHLALHNTLLLRCYAASDTRVRPLILFVKNWAKVRAINTAYRGTLNSYGYVLMVLHYLVNVAQPFVCPNLQLVNKEAPAHLSADEAHARSVCEGRDVRFWRNEAEIRRLSEQGMLNHNKETLGYLLRGFFEYYAHTGPMSNINHRGFDWGREVLSLRTKGGILSKQEKGWTGAKTVVETSTIAAPGTPSKKEGDAPSTKTMEETKEIRYRYLFAIEDPFELDHNVARTVTHNGIVNIRDEFRRAWRIIKNVGRDEKEFLLDPVADGERKNGLKEAMAVIHGSSVEVQRSA